LELETPEEKLSALESFLLSRALRELAPNRSLVYAVHQLQHGSRLLPVRDLAAKIGISQKHLIDQFAKFVGLSPKPFGPACRFQRVLNLIEQKRRVEWSAIANDCGYYDQSHFIKEFHLYSGVNPSEYLTQRGEYVGYIPIS